MRRLGRFDKERSKPRSVLVSVPNCWDTRRILAKAREKWKLLSDRVFNVLPSLTKAESEQENMCLKKRREMIANETPATELKTRNFELLHNGTKVNLDEPSDWLENLNLMLVNARSLLNFDRQTKFAKTVMSCRHPIVIVTVTWWNEDIEDSEPMLPGYILLRCERAVNKHGGVLVAIQSIISAKRISDDLPDGGILTIVDIQLKKYLVCVVYNHTLGSANRYTLADFEQVFRTLEEFKQYACLICGDFNLPKVNWSLNHSADEYELSVIEMFERHNFHQTVDFSTCGKNTLDFVFERKVENTTAKIDLVFTQLHDVSDHEPTLISIKEVRVERKTPVSNYFSFCNAEYDAMRREMTLFPFEATCFTNIDHMVEEFYNYIKSLIEKHCPKRTHHRQRMPP